MPCGIIVAFLLSSLRHVKVLFVLEDSKTGQSTEGCVIADLEYI